MASKIDLHIHTICSDGPFSPKQVIDMARKNGVDAIAIADHDSIKAYSDELFDYAKKCNIKLIPAVEISTIMPANNGVGTVGVHILGYNFDLKNKSFLKQMEKLGNVRKAYLYDVSKKIALKKHRNGVFYFHFLYRIFIKMFQKIMLTLEHIRQYTLCLRYK